MTLLFSGKMGAFTEIHKAGWWGLTASLVIISTAMAAGGTLPCLQCIEVRLEHPIVVRGPSPHEPDAPVSIMKLPDGSFRGFIAGGTTLAVDGSTPVALGGRSQVVLKSGPPGSLSDCGRWITTVMQGLGSLFGFVHEETRCNDPHGSYKSMAIAQSANDGLTWKVLGPIITSDEGSVPLPGRGEGDCTGVDGHDGYWYAYCLRTRDGKNIVARAPVENPAPGKWVKWTADGWHASGLGGTGATLDGFVGPSAAYWTEANFILLLATNASLRLSISEDKVHFGTVAEPLILYDEDNWQRPASTELYAYPSMVAEQGLNDIAYHFFLTYTYIPPGEDFSQRYLIMQEAWIRASSIPQFPQVRTALSRWVSSDDRTWTTTGPPITSGRLYNYDVNLGYLMTAAPQQTPGTKLDECFSPATGIGFLAEAGHCVAEGSERRRAAGYVFRSEQPGTIALYNCMSNSNAYFVSQDSDCENKGVREGLIGFALQ
jgi:hypothetical protein